MGAYPSVRIAGATDVDRSLSAAFVDRFGGVHYPSLDDVLGDPNVDAIVNLTVPAVHAEVTTAALHAGKHVHSEKPLAGSYAAARSLVDLAADRGLRLSCSPITFMGEAQQTMWRLVDVGRDRPGSRRIRRGQLEPDRELAPSARALLPHRAVRRRRRLSTHDPHGRCSGPHAASLPSGRRLSRPHDD